MKNLITFLFFAFIVTCVYNQDDDEYSPQSLTTINKILDTFSAKGNTKDIFKVWHLLFKPSYEVNTEEGINKYKNFKANLKSIVEHNKQNLSWTAGINKYTDMTFEELKTYFNIKVVTAQEFKTNIRGLLSLDDYDDSQDDNPDPPQANDPDPPQSPIVEKSDISWQSKLNSVRNQGGCGSNRR